MNERERQRESGRETDTAGKRATNNYEQFQRKDKDDSFVFCDQNYAYTDRLEQTNPHKHTYKRTHVKEHTDTHTQHKTAERRRVRHEIGSNCNLDAVCLQDRYGANVKLRRDALLPRIQNKYECVNVNVNVRVNVCV